MRTSITFIGSGILILVLFAACIFTGAVSIPADDVLAAFFMQGDADPVTEAIVLEARLPMTLTALAGGMALAISGLILQTAFSNPLAGPSILGVSTGASLGVALTILGPAQWIGCVLGNDVSYEIGTVAGAIMGAGVIILILTAFSASVKSATMLLIAGIMIGYLSSAVISWLNFFAPAEEVKTFALWGMGSFMGVTLDRIPLFLTLTAALCIGSFLMAKPLNALLLGDKYAASMGYNPRRVRTSLLLYSGILTAIVTAYCGPIGFLGLAVPHIARILFRTSQHTILIPATLMLGAATGMMCAWMCVLPSSKGVLPLSAVTPIIGVPVILYVILRRNKIYYFN